MTYEFDTPVPPWLELELVGADVVVSSWDRPETKIVTEARGGGDATDAFTVEPRTHTDRLQIAIAESSAGGLLRRHRGSGVAVRCPEGTAIVVRSRTSDAALAGVLGRIEVRTGTGDVVLRDVAASARVVVASGDVSMARVLGDCSISSAAGDIVVRDCGGPLAIHSVSGDVVVGHSDGRTRVQTISGDVRVEAAAGAETVVQTVSGDIALGLVDGVEVWIDAHSVSGSMSVSIDPVDEPTGGTTPGVLRVKSISGDVKLTGGVPAPSRSPVPDALQR